MTTKLTIEDSIKLAKSEIRESIADGTFPSSISSFDELHNYCDANELGGLSNDEHMDTLTDDEFVSYGEIVHTKLNQWIVEGMS